MKKVGKFFMFIFLIFAVSVTFGEVSTKVFLRDSNELLVPVDVNSSMKYVDYGQIMVGTELAIVIYSDVVEISKSMSLYLEDNNRSYGSLTDRGPESIYDSAGDALIYESEYYWPEEDKDVKGFELITGIEDVNVGDWFVIDYNAVEISDCNVAFYWWEYGSVPDHGLIHELWFTHVPTRDFDNDGVVDFNDFSIFASYWFDDCNEPNSCQGVNLDDYSLVDFNDLMLFTEYWLEKTK